VLRAVVDYLRREHPDNCGLNCFRVRT
jgi:hypothetical protein